jgi:histidine triad (HIT) family protein
MIQSISSQKLYKLFNFTTNTMPDCLFCKIIKGEVPSVKVYEDEHTYAFFDINPTNIGHTLVVPKEHFENIHDISEDALCQVMHTVKKIAPAIQKAVNADGLNIASNNNKAAGQIIFHAHTHIIPRFEDDGLVHWKGARNYNEGEVLEIAEKIKGLVKSN